jgi:hypothetical protein
MKLKTRISTFPKSVDGAKNAFMAYNLELFIEIFIDMMTG